MPVINNVKVFSKSQVNKSVGLKLFCSIQSYSVVSSQEPVSMWHYTVSIIQKHFLSKMHNMGPFIGYGSLPVVGQILSLLTSDPSQLIPTAQSLSWVCE